MDVVSLIINTENVKTLVLLVGILAGVVFIKWQLGVKIGGLEKSIEQKMNGMGVELRGEIAALGTALRGEMDERFTALRGELGGEIGTLRGEIGALRGDMNALGVALRGELGGEIGTLRGEISALREEMDERFTAFHKTLKENDFAHLNETIKALTFTLQKNKILEPEDKRFVDSHLENAVMT